ncbi:MAG: PilZ domain-containing protein [Deltaproteobacteria bacterium]|nr:PilZ domain-containing protein [Deltaproteobacteria bacterium]
MRSAKNKHYIFRPNSEKKDHQAKPIYQIRSSSHGSDGSRRKTGGKGQLVDILNYINFQGSTIVANFKHKKFNRSITRHLRTRPCHGSRLDCLWANRTGIDQILKFYQFQNLLITDENMLLLVIPELIGINKDDISFKLPEKYTEISKRKVKRQACTGIDVQMAQESSIYSGKLVEFSPLTFRVEVSATPPQNFLWINPESKVNLILSSANENLFSGECKILRQTSGSKTRTYILEAVKHQVHVFRPTEHRSARIKLVPSPDIIFKHPFTGEMISRKIVDVSGSGFAVEEAEESSVLLPGMVIPELDLCFAGDFRLKCMAQILYRKHIENDDGNLVKCGIAILDMNLRDHMKLMAILNQAENKNSYIDNKVNIDALWKLFFKTRLINPEKYKSMQVGKEKIKASYKKLYDSNLDLARHFIYQTNGTIKGHTAMLRFYEKSWLIHHEAAGSPIVRARLGALSQVARFVCDSHRFSSIHMDYIMNYFSPENKLSNLVFRGTARSINDPTRCSLDSFAYFHYKRSGFNELPLSEPWRLIKTTPQDLAELEDFYNFESKGLMTKALDLSEKMAGCQDLSKEYQKLGLKRGQYLLSLKKHDSLKAVILVNISDIGLNISDLTSCIKVFVLDQEYLPQRILYSMLYKVLVKIKRSEIPVLLFPTTYATEQAIPIESYYYLWILKAQHSDQFFNYINWLTTPKSEA